MNTYAFRRPRLALGLLLLSSLMARPAAASDAQASTGLPRPESLVQYARPHDILFPTDNGYSAERAALGQRLFFDPRLSGSKWISCASCHNPGLAWGDGLPKAIGHGMKELGRRTPTILNSAWVSLLFWDGRAASLEEQALGPVSAPGEMNMPLDAMVATVAGIDEYRTLFKQAYRGEPVTAALVAKAIATYERTIVSGTAPFDRWVSGDEQALSEAARRGFTVFEGKGRCALCHASWRFTDDSFHDIGVQGADPGRGKVVPIDATQNAFKTPTLRNVTRRAPYMHNGTESTLADVIELYDLGGRIKRDTLSQDLHPLHLSRSEKTDLLAFLNTLTSDDSPVTIPALPR